MRIILTVKTGKGKNSSMKDLDKTVDKMVELLGAIDKKTKRYKLKCQINYDGETVILTKK